MPDQVGGMQSRALSKFFAELLAEIGGTIIGLVTGRAIIDSQKPQTPPATAAPAATAATATATAATAAHAHDRPVVAAAWTLQDESDLEYAIDLTQEKFSRTLTTHQIRQFRRWLVGLDERGRNRFRQIVQQRADVEQRCLIVRKYCQMTDAQRLEAITSVGGLDSSPLEKAEKHGADTLDKTGATLTSLSKAVAGNPGRLSRWLMKHMT